MGFDVHYSTGWRSDVPRREVLGFTCFVDIFVSFYILHIVFARQWLLEIAGLIEHPHGVGRLC